MESLESSREGEAAAAEAEQTPDAGVRGRTTSAAATSSVARAVPGGVPTGSLLDSEPLRMAPVATDLGPEHGSLHATVTCSRAWAPRGPRASQSGPTK
eukprot:4706653-Prymnesium_polylepis.1